MPERTAEVHLYMSYIHVKDRGVDILSFIKDITFLILFPIESDNDPIHGVQGGFLTS